MKLAIEHEEIIETELNGYIYTHTVIDRTEYYQKDNPVKEKSNFLNELKASFYRVTHEEKYINFLKEAIPLEATILIQILTS